MTGASLPPSRPEPPPANAGSQDSARLSASEACKRSFTDASFAASARHPTTPRTPLAASPHPTRSRPRPVPPPIRAAPWLRSLALFGGGWRDSRAAHDSRGPCSERCPFLARSSRGVSSDGGLRGFSDTWRAYLAKTSSFWMHGGDILPRTGVFPVRGPFENASGHNLAIARHPGTHFASILPPPNSREHVADMCAYPAVSVHAAAAEEPGGDGGGGARGGISAPSVEHGNRRPQACATAGRDGGRGCARPRDGAAGGGGDTSCGGNCATRVRMNPFTPTLFRCGTVIKIICYVTNK